MYGTCAAGARSDAILSLSIVRLDSARPNLPVTKRLGMSHAEAVAKQFGKSSPDMNHKEVELAALVSIEKPGLSIGPPTLLSDRCSTVLSASVAAQPIVHSAPEQLLRRTLHMVSKVESHARSLTLDTACTQPSPQTIGLKDDVCAGTFRGSKYYLKESFISQLNVILVPPQQLRTFRYSIFPANSILHAHSSRPPLGRVVQQPSNRE
ncbi:hypothetical protein M427DRAFT_41664 [Gonapodya prolifera JEL478]|uniref:Uncharacterized protein n=1 Tax=Gonapodya prolifera (strain JEL478) TaxID=1344416 RepID=A0A139ASU9_GONPJ|nr:hypothetical protein M427DRAFT_41664 [Gonapodya prolifera JEL478]|eukprot:KXS19812.1 hypothetical protein M427DRAFT_41664 [Gonapodya prolifera JEL478]